MNCTFILANIINSKLVLFSARFAEKLYWTAALSTGSDGDSLSICVYRLRSVKLALLLDLNLPYMTP